MMRNKSVGREAAFNIWTVWQNLYHLTLSEFNLPSKGHDMKNSLSKKYRRLMAVVRTNSVRVSMEHQYMALYAAAEPLNISFAADQRSMKYPQLVPMPSAVQDWLDEQLEARGIDAVVYTRYILSLLQRDSADLPDNTLSLSPGKGKGVYWLTKK
uniref:Uncharacterized protein n=1 Tax=Timema douglasi TaxID=61478 RepID=A0A7R8ZA20_TIMDO|nr:unnamed protein product [Timema douglasi]